MSNPQYIPGPYKLHIHKKGGLWDYQIRTVAPHGHGSDIGAHIATVNPWSCPGRNATATGNLLAAAPDLLESAKLANDLCKLITEWCNAERDAAFIIMDEIVALAQDETQPADAIAKATGESSHG